MTFSQSQAQSRAQSQDFGNVQVEPAADANANSKAMVDPPALLRHAMRRMFDGVILEEKRSKRRAKAEAARIKANAPHKVEYFHQFDDPYSHLAAQVLTRLGARYNIALDIHFVRATGGRNQPEALKLAQWARRDAQLIAPHYGLDFPADAPLVPDAGKVERTLRALLATPAQERIRALGEASAALWAGSVWTGASGDRGDDRDDHRSNNRGADREAETPAPDVAAALDRGSARLEQLKHYSGAMFYYAGEWYWGVDRLFYLEDRLRALGAGREPSGPLLCPRPPIDVEGYDARALTLDFYPSLNSPYTAIIYDRTIELARQCGLTLRHKPVLPMIMRGAPVTREKGLYIMFDTKRESEHLGVAFGPVMTPIGEPTRQIYSLIPWAATQGKDTALMSACLNLAFREGAGLHKRSGLRKAVERAGLDWKEASTYLGSEEWKIRVAHNQAEMTEGLGLWGVPSFRLSGGADGADGEELSVWGQDRLWLIAAEIRKRCARAA